MDRTMTLTLALAALLMIAPAVVADDTAAATAGEGEDTPCDVFWYSIDPVGYKLNLRCLPIPDLP